MADGGFALVGMSVPTVEKWVFLRVASTIPTVMHGMTPSSATVQEAAFGRSKSPAFAGAKTTAYWRPPPNPSQWAGASMPCSGLTLAILIVVGEGGKRCFGMG